MPAHVCHAGGQPHPGAGAGGKSSALAQRAQYGAQQHVVNGAAKVLVCPGDVESPARAFEVVLFEGTGPDQGSASSRADGLNRRFSCAVLIPTVRDDV